MKNFLIFAFQEATLITKEIAVSGWENIILTVANWLNYSEIIRNLPVYLKQELLQTTWLIWGKLERIAMTAQMRVNRQCGKDVSYRCEFGEMRSIATFDTIIP